MMESENMVINNDVEDLIKSDGSEGEDVEPKEDFLEENKPYEFKFWPQRETNDDLEENEPKGFSFKGKNRLFVESVQKLKTILKIYPSKWCQDNS